MDTAFLRQVASKFVNDNLDDYTFVFPNRRSSLFFLKHLRKLKLEREKKPLFAPRFFTIDKLFDYLSDLERVDDLTLTFCLWEEYHRLQEEYQRKEGVKEGDMKFEDVDSFFLWGKIILSDFNDVDQYMVPASRLFKNVEDYNCMKVEPSSFLSEEQIEALKKLFPVGDAVMHLTDARKDFLRLWEMLLPLYTGFRKSLSDEHIAYPGMLCRQVAEDVASIDKEPNCRLKNKLNVLGKVVFIGLSAPTKAEKVLMRYFQKEGGLFFWDFYSDWIKAEQNRSSRLISSCVKEFPNSLPLMDNGGCSEGKCKFVQIPASGATGQAIIANELLKETGKEEETGKEGESAIETALVVSDESLLLPILETIEQKNYNVTMGYPLKATSTASFFINLFNLHLRCQKTLGEMLFPGELFMSLLGHPFIKDTEPVSAGIASNKIRSSNLYLIGTAVLDSEEQIGLPKENRLVRFLKKLLPEENMFKANAPSDICSNIISHYRSVTKELLSFRRFSPEEKMFLKTFLEILEKISAAKVPFNDERTIYSVIRASIKTAMVPFKGEPLKGLQIMGALETRALDFERVIFLSFNDGTYPASGESSSCIPYFLRKFFELPTYEDDNSISAYNFYRLIQRASEVYMIYDTSNTDSLRSKEESRFIKQLKYDFGITPEIYDFKFPLPSAGMQFTGDLVMTDNDRKSLGCFFSDLNQSDKVKAFSPSSLNAYLGCQRRFFLEKIMGIREESDFSDVVEASTFGSIFHFCMEKIYENYKGKLITPDVMNRIKTDLKRDSNLENLILEAFKNMKIPRIDGQNKIIEKSVIEYIWRTLKADTSKAEKDSFILVETEREPKDKYINLGNGFFNSYFTGKIDRLEEIDGVPRICDYKTGTFLKPDKPLSAFLDKEGFQCSSGKHYLPFKEMPEGKFQKGINKDKDIFEYNLDKIFSPSNRDEYYSILFQMFVYALLFREEEEKRDFYDLSVYQLRILGKCGPITIRITDSQLDRFASRLKDLVCQIRKLAEVPNSRITVCTNDNNCKYCYFNIYCRRVKNED